MPIEVATTIEACDQEAFHALDKRIMRILFDLHNDFGRLMDEEVYKREAANCCIAAGILPTEREVQIRVSHQSFFKDYFMDMLFCHGVMFELKVVDRLAPVHRAQSLNYMLLAGLKHGRLVNFRTERVQREFVSTTLTPSERRRFRVDADDWEELDDESRFLKSKTIELLSDWGAFLDVNLYREALIHFLGGATNVCRGVQICSGSRPVAIQNLNLLNEHVAFAVTCIPRRADIMRNHLERLLAHTQLLAFQWINLNRHTIEFYTLSRNRTDRIMEDRILKEAGEKSPHRPILPVDNITAHQ